MAHHDDGALVAAQEALQPLHRLQIQVVGGLVQQQDFRVADQQLRQGDAHLPAAGEVVGGAGQVGLFESQAEQHAAHLRLKGIAAHALVGVAGAPGGRQLRLGGVGPQFRLQLVKAPFGFQHFHLRGQHFFEDGAVGHFDGLLLQVAHTGPLRSEDAPLVRVVFAGDDVQQRGFAGAVRAHQRQTVEFFQLEGNVVEQLSSAVGFRNMFGLQNHVLLGAFTSRNINLKHYSEAHVPHPNAPAESPRKPNRSYWHRKTVKNAMRWRLVSVSFLRSSCGMRLGLFRGVA